MSSSVIRDLGRKVSASSFELIENAKKATEAEAIRIAAAHEAAVQATESSEQRRLRERLRVEEADHGLTEDLFGGGSNSNSKDTAAAAAPAAGLDGIPLKTLQDHVKLALELGQKLSSSSKSPSIVALFKELLTLVEGKLSLEETNELFQHLNKFRDAKVVADQKKKAILKKQQEASRKRTQEQAKKKQHKELFGGNYDGVGDQYDEVGASYQDKYDDFM
eukprot:12051-Heterococcus_DN1.PRE.1